MFDRIVSANYRKFFFAEYVLLVAAASVAYTAKARAWLRARLTTHRSLMRRRAYTRLRTSAWLFAAASLKAAPAFLSTHQPGH
jgi:hypothetical protein